MITSPYNWAAFLNKHCLSCNSLKPLGEFGKNSQGAGGIQATCKSCKNDYNKQYYAANRDKERKRSRLKRYGLTDYLFANLWDKQCGECGICGVRLLDIGDYATGRNRPENACCVDHDHETGKVRGLLCMSCNLLIGYAKDSPARLDAAKKYLIQLGGVAE